MTISQARHLVRDVMNDASGIGWSTTSSATCLTADRASPATRAFEYFRNVDMDLGERVEGCARAQSGGWMIRGLPTQLAVFVAGQI